MNFDAYTLRKIAPRLLLAVIGVNLSIYLCVAAVDIATVAGHGIGQLIRGPFDVAGVLDSPKIDQGAGNIAVGASAILLLLVAVPAFKGGALATLFFLMLPVFVLILSILITLVLRQALVVLLTMVAPVAIVLSVLPGTEKYFKQWWDLFVKTLVVYPLIAALFAVSDVLTAISFAASNQGGNTTGAVDVISGVMFAFMPLVMIPFAFRFAGGALGAMSNATAGMRGMANRMASGRLQKNFQKGYQDIKAGGLFTNYDTDEQGKGRGLRHRMNRFAQGVANLDQVKMTRPIQSLRTAGMDDSIIHAIDEVKQSGAYKATEGFDDEEFVAAVSDGTAADIDKLLIERAPQRYNHNESGISTAEKEMRRENLIDSRNKILNLYKVRGVAAGKAAMAATLPSISTSFDTQYALTDGSGPWIKGLHDESQKSDKVWATSEDQMQEMIYKATGGNVGVGNYVLGQALSGAKQAGRYDMAASASAVLLYQEALRSGDEEAIEEARKNYKEMVRKRVTPAQALQGHPRAAKETAREWREYAEELINAGATADKSKWDPKRDSPEQMERNQELLRLLADARGFQDVLGSAGSEAVDAFDDGFFGHKADGATSSIQQQMQAITDLPEVAQRRYEWRTMAEGEHAAAQQAAEEAQKATKPPEVQS